MNVKQLILICGAMLATIGAEAQQWTLDSCINYAMERNISLQQSKLTAESAEVDVWTSKGALFPSLSFSTSQSLSYRPYQESSATVSGSEIIEVNNKTSYTGSYNLSASWTIYQGGINRKTIKQNELTARSSQLDAEETANNIEESIVQNYLQILYAQESVKVNENTLETSTAQRDRGKELLDAGKLSRTEYAQLEAQVSSDRYQLVSSQSSLQNYKLQLKQLLEIEGDEDMDLYAPEVDDDVVLSIIPAKQEVFEAALDTRPEIQSSKIDMEVSELDVKIAKAGKIPTIALSAGVSANHTSGNDYNFSEQMKTSWNNSIGLSVNVPIFSNRQTRGSINRAKIQYKNSELNYQQEYKDLYQSVESLWLDANNYQAQYISAKDNTASAAISYDLVCEQFDLGMVNTVDLLQEKNNYLSAQQEMLQTKYMAVMSRLLLNFYAGETVTL